MTPFDSWVDTCHLHLVRPKRGLYSIDRGLSGHLKRLGWSRGIFLGQTGSMGLSHLWISDRSNHWLNRTSLQAIARLSLKLATSRPALKLASPDFPRLREALKDWGFM